MIESLGISSVMSGAILTLSKRVECFSLVFSLHQRLPNFCLAAGYHFKSSFDYVIIYELSKAFYKMGGLWLYNKATSF